MSDSTIYVTSTAAFIKYNGEVYKRASFDGLILAPTVDFSEVTVGYGSCCDGAVSNSVPKVYIDGISGPLTGANGTYILSNSGINGRAIYINGSEPPWYIYWCDTCGSSGLWILTDTQYTTGGGANWIADGSGNSPGTFDPAIGNNGFTQLTVTGYTSGVSSANGTYYNTGSAVNGRPAYVDDDGWYIYWCDTCGPSGLWITTDTPYTTAAPAVWIADGSGGAPSVFDSSNGSSTEFTSQTGTSTTVNPQAIVSQLLGSILFVTGLTGSVSGANGAYDIDASNRHNNHSTWKNDTDWYIFWCDTCGNNQGRWVLSDTAYSISGTAAWIQDGNGVIPTTFGDVGTTLYTNVCSQEGIIYLTDDSPYAPGDTIVINKGQPTEETFIISIFS